MSATVKQSGGAKRVRLGDLLRLRKEIVHPHDNPSGPAIFVGLEHIESGTGRRIGQLEVEKSRLTGRKPAFKKGDIVYGYLRPYLNKVWVADFDGLCSVDQYVYSVNTETADPHFIAWFLRSPVFLGRAPIASSPGQLPRIRIEEVAAVQVHLPCLADQHRILELLSEQMTEVERARAAAEARLEAAQELEASFLRETLANQNMESWPPRNLGEICRVVGGSTPPSGLPEYWNGDIVWITPTDLGRLRTPVICDSERHISRLGYESCGTDLVPIGTVLISSRAPIGHVAIAGVELCTNQGCKSLIPGPSVDSNYLYFAVKFSVPKIRELGSGATFAEVSKTTLARFPVALPPLDGQRRIASELTRKIQFAANLKTYAGAELQGLHSVPAALLRHAFSGEF